MKKYKHLFFDLDRTLWDFNRNSFEAISDLFYQHRLDQEFGIEANTFFTVYDEINHTLWAKYRSGKVTKDQLRLLRFHTSFKKFGLNDEKFALSFNNLYVGLCSSKPNLVANTKLILDYLSPNYNMHIITNGFKEAQYIKLKNSGLENYFDIVIVSDELGYRKPDKRIFELAMKKATAKPEDSLMIGDDYGADIIGAMSVGMDQVYFSNEAVTKEASYQIATLMELKNIL